jgi:hypothetical protein
MRGLGSTDVGCLRCTPSRIQSPNPTCARTWARSPLRATTSRWREPVWTAAEALAEAAGARAILAHCRLGRARVAQRLRLGSRAAELAREAADLFERLGDLDRAYEARALH